MSTATTTATAVEHDPPEPDRMFLDARLDESLVEQCGHDDGRQLAIVLRDDGGNLIGGVQGLTWGGCCELLTLWVEEAHRGQGLATRLLRSAETEARLRRCTQIVLFTHSLAPPRLYIRAGYEVVGAVPDYPRGRSAFLLRKSITAIDGGGLINQ